jgi:cation transport ATPase
MRANHSHRPLPQRITKANQSAALPMEKNVMYVDVDGTLERKFLGFEKSNKTMVDAIRRLHAEGMQIYIWSTGGAGHARDAATKCGVEELCAGFLPKPNICVDDKPPSRWKDFKRLKPRQMPRFEAPKNR